MTQEELNKVIENHQHWLKRDSEDWEAMRANLEHEDLSGLNFNGANLSGASLDWANFKKAKLDMVNLEGATLISANFEEASLYEANLNATILEHANFSRAFLNEANIKRANLDCANFEGAALRGTNLDGSSLCWANLNNASLRMTSLCMIDLRGAKNIPFIPMVCPEYGSFIGFKKASDKIVVLEITADAKRSSATGRKCRCNKAKVIDIQNINPDEPCNLKSVSSNFNKNFVYTIGEIVEENRFSEDRWRECAPGIHFFISRQEAVNY